MCNIFYLKKDQTVNFEQFANCVYNNWHSFGLVIFKGKGVCEVKKGVPSSGELDPKELFDLLEEHKKYDRLLHVRHNTAGATTLENTHPFTVFEGDCIREGKERKGEYVGFMHNGTMYSFVSKKTSPSGVTENDPDGKSDTLNFVEKRLRPLLEIVQDKDIKNETLIRLMQVDFPSSGNRGVVFNNSGDLIFMGDWKVWKDADGNELKVANDTYFDKVTRGPEFDRREARRKEEEAKRVVTQSTFLPHLPTSSKVIEDYLMFKPEKLRGYFAIKGEIPEILSDYEIWTREGISALAYLDRHELQKLTKDTDLAGALLDFVCTEFQEIYEELEELLEKKGKAEKRIQALTEELLVYQKDENNETEKAA